MCGNRLLKDGDSFSHEYSRPIDTSSPDFDPDQIEFAFRLGLKCSSLDCGSRVMCIGKGGVEQDYVPGGKGDWDWFEYFEPLYFHPSLKLSHYPIDTPLNVAYELEESFALFFSSPSASIGKLRVAVEALLDDLNVPSTTSNGAFLTLGPRLRKMPEELKNALGDSLSALTLLGNAGAHGDHNIRKSNVLDGYRVITHVLEILYPVKGASIDDLIEKIQTEFGPKKNES